MLILAGNKAINFEQVFCLMVEGPILNCRNRSKSFCIMAYHSAIEGEYVSSDQVVIKYYSTPEDANDALKKIFSAYSAGIRAINLDTD